VLAVREFPIPNTVRAVRQFVGLASYYRRFIPNFADKAKPLHQLLEKEQKFHWTVECQQSFEILKEALISAPILIFPDFTKPFTIITDASSTGIGAILCQAAEDRKEHVICYASRVLQPPERNYTVSEQECLAIVWAMQQFRHYLYGQSFEVITDHSALQWLFNIPKPTGRLARWIMQIQQFKFKVIHRKGKANTNADALSRMFEQETGQNILTVTHDNLRDIYELQSRDSDIVKLKSSINSNNSNNSKFFIEDRVLKRWFHRSGSNTRDDKYKQIVLPKSLRAEILYLCHDNVIGGHLGFLKTYEKVRERFWWPKMKEEIAYWVNSCEDCQSRKGSARESTFSEPISIGEPFDMLGVDIMGPLPTTKNGHKYIVVFTEYLTKWVEAFPIVDADSVTVAKLLVEQVICRYGAPRKLLSDQGKVFLSHLILDLCKYFGIQKVNTAAYRPQTDGLTEKFNHTLANMLSMYVSANKRDWDEIIPYVLFAFRTSIQESIMEKPFYLMFGREPHLPIDVAMDSFEFGKVDATKYRETVVTRIQTAMKLAREHIMRAQKRQVELAHSRGVDKEFKVGESVWLYTPVFTKGIAKKFQHY
jgi:hypothetical protein